MGSTRVPVMHMTKIKIITNKKQGKKAKHHSDYYQCGPQPVPRFLP